MLALVAAGCEVESEAGRDAGAGQGPAPGASADAPAAAPDRPRILEVAFGDSVHWEDMLGEGWLKRVVVRTDRGSDTLPGVLTNVLPVLVGDSVVLGFAREGAAITGAFRYRAGADGVEELPLPDDLNRGFAAPAISPDGRHIAYVANRGEGMSWAVLRTWPEGRELAASDTTDVQGSDFSLSNARWLDAERFEALVDAGIGYLLFTGTVSGGFVEREAFEEPPEWALEAAGGG